MHISTSQWQILLFALLVLAIMTCVAWAMSGKVTEEEYLIGGRNVPYGRLSAAIAAGVIGGGVLLVYTEYAFRFGLGALFIIAGIVAGTLLMVPAVKKFKQCSDDQKFYSLPDLYHHFWGPRAALLATIIIFMWTAGFILMQLISAGEVLLAMTGMPYSIGVVVAAGTVASYLILKGFKAVVITDILQYGALVVLLIVVFFPAAAQVDLRVALIGAVSLSFDWGEAVGFFILGCLNMLVSADMWQRVYAAKDEASAKRAFKLAALLVALAGILLLVPALFARTQLPTVAPNAALFRTLELLLPSNMWLGFGLVGILATIIACLDTMVFVFGISVGHDVVVMRLAQPVEDRLRSTKISILLTLVMGAIISIVCRELMPLALALSMLGLILAPAIVMAIFGKFLTRGAVELGMLLGLVTTALFLLTCFWHRDWLTPQNTLITLAFSILGTIIGQLRR